MWKTDRDRRLNDFERLMDARRRHGADPHNWPVSLKRSLQAWGGPVRFERSAARSERRLDTLLSTDLAALSIGAKTRMLHNYRGALDAKTHSERFSFAGPKELGLVAAALVFGVCAALVTDPPLSPEAELMEYAAFEPGVLRPR